MNRSHGAAGPLNDLFAFERQKLFIPAEQAVRQLAPQELHGPFVIDDTDQLGQAAIDQGRPELKVQHQHAGLETFQDREQIGPRLLPIAQADLKLLVLGLQLPFEGIRPRFETAIFLNQSVAALMEPADETLEGLNILLRLDDWHQHFVPPSSPEI
ncbi:MAG: hypothetical protein HYV01_26115 [Deltaproteobacteria bacterium]|nr:hypothetical protein [Deltaproteobacteria bacterium]